MTSDDAVPIVVLDTEADVAALPLAAVIPPPLLARLASYAQGRLTAGVGVDRLQATGLAVPAFIDLYQPGYLPPDYRQALAPAEADLLSGCDLADCCVCPAFNAQGALVDLICWRLVSSAAIPIGSLRADPAGLPAPRITALATAMPLVIVESLDDLLRRLTAGERQVLLLRPDVPPSIQLVEVRDRGVRSVQLAMATIPAGLPAICRTLGLTVVDPSAAAVTAADWHLVSIDRSHHRAVFQTGDLVVALDTPQNSTCLNVDARRGDGRHQHDRFDLAVPRQVRTFTALAARKLGVDASLLLSLLDGDIIERLRALEAGESATVPTARTAGATTAAPAEREADPAGPALVEHFLGDTTALGWVGDDRAKVLSLLTLAALNLEQPSWLLLRGPAAITLPVVGLLADLLPPEHRLHLSRAVEGSLGTPGPDGLRHRLLVIDDAAALRPATVTTLQVLSARGGIAMPVAVREAATGRMISRLTESQGPTGMLAAAAVGSACDDLALVVDLDASPTQTARAMAATCQTLQAGVDRAARSRIRARWQGILGALPTLPVRIPGADRVVFPSRHPRHRIEQRRFFSLVAASALLHYRERPQLDGCIVATDADIQAVIRATSGLLGRIDDGLSDRARQLVAVLAHQAERTMSTPAISAAFPSWTRNMVRGACDELVRAGLVISPSSGRGRRSRSFTLVPEACPEAPTIQLLPTGQVMPPEDGWNWGEAPNPTTNIIPAQAVG